MWMHGPKTVLVTRAVLVERSYWTVFHATRVRTISACPVDGGKTALNNVESFLWDSTFSYFDL